MATTTLTDVYVPLPFNRAVDERATESNAFAASGVLAGDSVLDNLATVGGKTGELPFYNPLSTASEPNISSDNPASASTPKNIGYAKEIYRRSSLNDSWSTMDLTRELALADPLTAITNKIGDYWGTQMSKRIIAAMQGILADNVANDSSDMLYTAYEDLVVGSLDADNYMSAANVLNAQQTIGDKQNVFSTLVVHSVPYTKLLTNDLIAYKKDSEGNMTIPTFMGLQLIVDDALPVTSGTNTPKYLSILAASGAIAWGKGTVPVPSEIERIPSQGDGGGQDVIYSRRADIIHPYGFQSTGTPSGDSQTIAELQAAGAWDRVRDRKNVGIAFLETN